MTNLDYTRMRSMVKAIAQSVSRQFPSYVTSDDTEGHLWVHMYERKGSYSKIVQEGDWEPQVASLLRKVAMDYCQKEKAAVEGYSTDDLYRYSLPKIRLLLPDVFEYEDWQSFGLHGDGQPSAKIQANQTGDRIVELTDVKAAVERLNDDTYNLLVWQYKYHYTIEMLAEEFGITLEAAKKRAQRAVTAVQKELGRRDSSEQPSPAARRTVRTNAAMMAVMANQYEGN